MPKRVQYRRAKGWRKPPDAVYVGRPGIFGNPFHGVERQRAVELFRLWLAGKAGNPDDDWRRERLLASLDAIRGKDLGCFCPLDHPCHADVLLELANAPDVKEKEDG